MQVWWESNTYSPTVDVNAEEDTASLRGKRQLTGKTWHGGDGPRWKHGDKYRYRRA